MLATALISLFISDHVSLWQPLTWSDRGRKRIYKSSRKSVIGFRRKGIEKFLEITLHTRHGLLRRSSNATRATLSLRDISWMTRAGEAKHLAWCCSIWAFAYEVLVHQGISRFFVRYFIDGEAYSSISTSNFFDLTWHRSQTEQLCKTVGRTFR